MSLEGRGVDYRGGTAAGGTAYMGMVQYMKVVKQRVGVVRSRDGIAKKGRVVRKRG